MGGEQLGRLAVPLCSDPEAGDHPDRGSLLVLLLAEIWPHSWARNALQADSHGSEDMATLPGQGRWHPPVCCLNDPDVLCTPGTAGSGEPSLLPTQLSAGKGKLGQPEPLPQSSIRIGKI